jgi:putative ABC transport system substrate-binding protein
MSTSDPKRTLAWLTRNCQFDTLHPASDRKDHMAIDRKNRRVFMAVVAATAAWPLTSSAQSATAPRRVVLLSAASDPADRVGALREQLSALGYVEGRNIRIDIRSAEGHLDRLPALAEGLVREGGIDAILAESTPAAVAARRATQTIPIVAIVGVDPVESGLVSSFAHPGGNVTGVAILADEANAKRVELLRELAPSAIRLAAVMAISGQGTLNVDSVRESGRKLGFAVELIVVDLDRLPESLGPSVVTGFDAFVFVPDVVLTARRNEIIKFIAPTKKPAIFPGRNWVDSGGWMSYGPDLRDATREWASQLVRVLKGEQPKDLPFERPTKFEFRINLRTAQAMGIEIPPALLARADEVIE